MEVLKEADLEKRLAGPEVDEGLRDDITEVEGRLDELAQMFASGDIGRREWMTAREALDDRLSNLRASETEQVGHRSSVADVRTLRSLGAEWDDLTIQRQRSVLELLIHRVTLDSAVGGRNFFDPDRVDVDWKV